MAGDTHTHTHTHTHSHLILLLASGLFCLEQALLVRGKGRMPVWSRGLLR
jgi:hypothetical protein